MLTTFQLDEYVFGALRAGASGFLLKDTPPVDIIRAVRLVAAGEAMLSPVGHPHAHRAVRRRPEPRPGARRPSWRCAALTDREREVAAEVAQGRSNAEIAARLYMSEATVKAHVSRVMAKLGAANRVQVAITVRDAGLA